MEPLNKGHVGTSHFVQCVERLPIIIALGNPLIIVLSREAVLLKGRPYQRLHSLSEVTLYVTTIIITVEPLNKGHIGISHFVHCIERLPIY